MIQWRPLGMARDEALQPLLPQIFAEAIQVKSLGRTDHEDIGIIGDKTHHLMGITIVILGYSVFF